MSFQKQKQFYKTFQSFYALKRSVLLLVLEASPASHSQGDLLDFNLFFLFHFVILPV